MTRHGASPTGGRPVDITNQGMGMTKPEGQQEILERLLLDLLPPNGTAVGNAALLERWTEAAAAAGIVVESEAFATLREHLVARGLVVKGKGRGGSTARSAAGAGTSDSFH